MSKLISEEEIEECGRFVFFRDQADCVLRKVKNVQEEKHQKKDDEQQKIIDQNAAKFKLHTVKKLLLDELATGGDQITMARSNIDCSLFPQSVVEKFRKDGIILTCKDRFLTSIVTAKYQD